MTVPPRTSASAPADASEDGVEPSGSGLPSSGTPGQKTAIGGRRRRWHRIAIPIGVAVLLMTITGITHAIDQPDPGAPGFLSPSNADDEGGSWLADKLRAQGVAVERMTSTRDALTLAAEDGFTLFVPAPALIHPLYLPYLTDPAAHSRVVLVDPPQRVLDGANLPLATAGRRWAARPVGTAADGRPCPLPEVAAAGTAAVLLQRYVNPPGLGSRPDYCYAGGLARTRWRGNDIIVVGASDPFRNDRVDERGNAALATGLLSRHQRVVWLDLTGPEPPPPSSPAGQPDPWTSTPEESGPYQDGESEQAGDDPAYEEPGESAPGPDDAQGADGDKINPLWDAFPSWFWALLGQLALALLLTVLCRARRLGPPVAEPLPVTVPAAETVFGRGRLYQRARAYGPTADILRAAALHRLLPPLNLPPDAGPEEVVEAVAARTGHRRGDVHDLLYGPAPETNDELLDRARALDILTDLPSHASTDPPRHHRPEGEAR